MKDQGDLSEIKFLLRATQEGLIVSQPFGDNQRYDFIVDTKDRLYRIQIKSTNYKEGNNFKVCTVHGSRVKKNYTIKEIDFLCVNIVSKNAWYIFPIQIVSERSTMRLSGNTSGKYSRYLEAWDLLV